MNFKTEFLAVENDPKKPGGGHSGAVVESYDRPVIINKLDPKETYPFYAYNDSQMFVHIWMPEAISYLRDPFGPREEARVLPQFEKVATFFPVTIKEQKPASETP